MNFIIKIWSSPKKDKNRKPPTREYVVTRKWTIRVNPYGGKQWGIPEKESLSITNPKGDPNGHQMELVPSRPRGNFKENPSGRLKEVIPRHQPKQRGFPEKKYLGIFTPNYDPSGHQK